MAVMWTQDGRAHKNNGSEWSGPRPLPLGHSPLLATTLLLLGFSPIGSPRARASRTNLGSSFGVSLRAGPLGIESCEERKVHLVVGQTYQARAQWQLDRCAVRRVIFLSSRLLLAAADPQPTGFFVQFTSLHSTQLVVWLLFFL